MDRFYHQAEQQIFQRLVQASIREQLVPKKYITDKESSLCIIFPEGESIELPVSKQFAFDCFDIAEGLNPLHFLDLMKRAGWIEGGSRYERFRAELQNSVENYALVLAAAEQRFSLMAGQADSSWEWLQNNPEESALVFYEQLVIDGHPLHPGAKIKMGMSQDDVAKYSPEWGVRFETRLAAVLSRRAVLTGADRESVTELLYQDDPSLREKVGAELRELGLNSKDYELLPLHPWQAEHTLPALYQRELEERELVLLQKTALPSAPLMSFRSLAPLVKRRRHLKTAVNVQMTGAVRTVSPQSVNNGPRLSRILRAVQEREKYFSGRFRILEEQAGIHLDPSRGTDEERFVLQKNAAALLRENPEWYIDDEVLMPAAALLARSPFSGKTVAMELIGAEADAAAVCHFIRQYAEVCLPPLLTCMSKYGVSMEGHLQNSLVAFRDGKAAMLMIRDFGGVRVVKERLEKQGLPIQLHAGSAIEADDVEDMRNKMFYPVFQNHFGCLIASLVRETGVAEQKLWGEVASVCRAVYRGLKEDSLIGRQAADDELALFAPFMDLKAMVTMRLRGDVTDYTFTKVRNPLSEERK